MKTDFLFSKQQEDKFNFSDEDLIELKPYGLSLNNDSARPFLILKDHDNEYSLPVAISQIEAGISLSINNTQQVSSNPHKFIEMILESFNVKLTRCVFSEISGSHQYVRLFMKGHPQYQSLKLRADEAMSLCIQFKVPFFATKSFINKSKILTVPHEKGEGLVAPEIENALLQQLGLQIKPPFIH